MAKTITHKGVTYEVVGGKAEPGDLIYYCTDEGDTVGVSRVAYHEFEIDDFYTTDNEYIWVAGGDSYEVIRLKTDRPTSSVTDLIANLARRVSELEAHNAQQAEEINVLYRSLAERGAL